MNKKVLITGASNGLGRQMARALAEEGCEVFNIDIQEQEHNHSVYFDCDTRDEEKVNETARAIEQDYGKIDIVINNASINHLSYLEDLKKVDMEKVIGTNVIGYYVVAKAFLPHLQHSKGTLVNIVSRAATQPMTASLAYNASKGAQLIMTKQMARELTKKDDITVFSISPSKLKGTQMSKYIDEKVCEVRGWTKEYAKKYQKESGLVSKETDPKIIANMLVDFLKNEHYFLTGCDLKVGN